MSYRRAGGDMIEVYKHPHYYDKETVKEFRSRTRQSRKHTYQRERMTPKDGIRGAQSNSFYYRAIPIWNNLPKKVVSAKNTADFKNKLDEAWKNIPMNFLE